MSEETKAFNQALSNFTFGVASRDLICHMAAEGYSVKQIHEACDYPTPLSKISETVWDYYIESGIILLEEPQAGERTEYDYVMDIGKFGRRSFRQVEKNLQIQDEYIACDIGIFRKNNPALYDRYLSVLDSRMRDYVEGLPWPPSRVWHIANLRMREIQTLWDRVT